MTLLKSGNTIAAAVPNVPSSSYIWCSTRYVFDVWKTLCIDCETSSNQILTGCDWFKAGSGVCRRNHGRAGLVAPDIKPAPKVFSDRVPVES